MENLFRKYGWVMRLALIALACLLVAIAINGFIASQLAPYTVPSLPEIKAEGGQTRRAARRTPIATTRDRVGAVSDRCLFGCADPEPQDTPDCPGGCPDGQSCVEGQCIDGPQDQPLPGDLPVASDLNLKLMGVMVSVRQPEWSSALLQDPDASTTYIVRPGDALMGEATLLDVRRDRIVFERNGRKEFIRLNDSITGDPSPNAPRRLAAAAPPSVLAPNAPGPDPAKAGNPIERARAAINEAPAEKNVTQVNENNYRVQGKSLDEKLKDRAGLARGASIVPNFKDGKKSGLKMISVDAGGVFGELGFRTGDVLRSVNGQEIRSQAHAMELMDQFRKSENVAVEIERGGKKQTIKYEIDR